MILSENRFPLFRIMLRAVECRILILRPSAKISNFRDIPGDIGINSQYRTPNAEFIPMHALDAIDRKILSLLQSDSRMTMQELADKVGLSVSPCHRRGKTIPHGGRDHRPRS